MAKRHSHYRRRGKPHGGRGGGRGNKRDSSRGQNNWHNSGLPMGDGDLNEPFSSDLYAAGGRRSFVSPDAVADYYFGRSAGNKSMKMGGMRPGQQSRSSNDLSGGKSSFRKRPVEFIKAKEVYDPSHDLIEQLRKNNTHSLKDQTVETTETHKQEDVDKIPEVEKSGDEVAQLQDKDIFYVDVTGSRNAKQSAIKTVKLDESYAIPITEERATEFNPTITIGKTELETEEHPAGSSITVRSDQNYHPLQQYISNVLGKIKPSSDDEGDDDGDEDEDLSMESMDESSSDEYEVPKSVSPRLSNNLETLKISESDAYPKPELKNEIEEEEPEFGFLDDDYLVDLSSIHVTNMRMGVSDNSYFVSCFRMFADHESRWISQELLSDFILEDLGFPEHRLGAYLKFIKAAVVPPEEPPQPNYSDVPISDESEDDSDPFSTRDDSIDADMREGLDDLIQFTTKYSATRNQEFQTSALETIGKGRKKKLLIDDSLALDLEGVATLQEKFSKRINTKANKRRAKEDFIDMENEASSDLLKKYPFGLHIHNIKDEFEIFLTSNRDRLSFPPLDPHGSKTVMKFTLHYNMKPSKFGKGNHVQVIAQKTKKTFRSFPNYNLIDQLLRQRPVFMRIDVSRPREPDAGSRKSKVIFHTTEGQVIGKDAPEIGCDNVGRRILEKLGWSNGEGLGAHGNKGISEPLMATVKKSKSGLRHSHK
ncbi:Sqs1p TDEL_0E00520 [Torulaspora delbrueckii]|uniref:Protein SQS1 n=1 Tax=Torulaspora delbrueckii TaxID=4950 RepID=G8ZUK1_TORDE|nr:hypothetical protein TDEL_0E00520 [Torulaspora delbrueckii]CCE92295.1 hypothetical protein TDEL_0E00520 [Torulaspora delbrueckii]